MYLGGIEAGGTKFVCAIGDSNGKILAREKIPTEEPQQTMKQVFHFFKNFKIAALGIGTFGPVDLDPSSDAYGTITSTPKRAWANYPLLKEMEKEVPVPIGVTTDVNAAALGELHQGAARGLDGCLYVTVGTGIGAGLITGNHFLQGLTHPEMGHVLLRRHPRDDFQGICPFHRDCLEGLASGPAIKARWDKSADELPADHPFWEIEADYLAQALMQYALILAPKRIIIGGGVMKQKQLFPLIRNRLRELLSGYLDFAELNDQIDNYVVPPALRDNSGIIGALLLARKTLEESDQQPADADGLSV